MNDTCQSCGKEIVWVKMPSGKMNPCDAAPVQVISTPKKLTIVTDAGEVFHGEEYPSPELVVHVGRVSHFSTCPDSKSWHGKKRGPGESGKQVAPHGE